MDPAANVDVRVAALENVHPTRLEVLEGDTHPFHICQSDVVDGYIE